VRVTDEELLAAYVDGVAELTPEERQRAAAALSELDADGTRAMIDQLRALPPEGTEPDWRALERRIAGAVDAIRPPWWRRWLLPVGVLAVGAAALALYVNREPAVEQPPAPVAVVIPDAAVPAPPVEPTEIWLNGHLLDVGDIDPDALDDLDEPTDLADEDSLLPAGDLGWVDQLDDRAIERAEHWLERKKS
jgi:hypothetical protein